MSPSLRDRLHDAKDGIRSSVGSNVKSAERAGSSKVQSVKERVSSVDREDAKRAVRSAGDQFGPGEVMTGRGVGVRDRDTFAAAEESSTMAPPVDASLRPTTSPEDIDGWVTGGATATENARETAEDVESAAETGSLGFQIDDFSNSSDDVGEMEDFVGLGSAPRHENAKNTAKDVKTASNESDAFTFDFSVGSDGKDRTEIDEFDIGGDWDNGGFL